MHEITKMDFDLSANFDLSARLDLSTHPPLTSCTSKIYRYQQTYYTHGENTAERLDRTREKYGLPLPIVNQQVQDDHRKNEVTSNKKWKERVKKVIWDSANKD